MRPLSILPLHAALFGSLGSAAQELPSTYLGQASLFIEPVVGASNVSVIAEADVTANNEVASVTGGTLCGPLVNATANNGVVTFSVANGTSGPAVTQSNQIIWTSDDGQVFTTVGSGIGTSSTNAQRLVFTAGGPYEYLNSNLVVCYADATTQSSNPSVADCYIIGTV